MRKKVKWWQFTLALMMNKQITEPVSDKQMNCFVLNEIAALFLSSSLPLSLLCRQAPNMLTMTNDITCKLITSQSYNNWTFFVRLKYRVHFFGCFLQLFIDFLNGNGIWRLRKLCQSPAKLFMERTVLLYHIDRIQSAVVWSRLLKAD